MSDSKKKKRTTTSRQKEQVKQNKKGSSGKKGNVKRDNEDVELVFLYDDDEKNPNYHPEQEEQRKEKRKKKCMMTLGIIAGTIAVIYFGMVVFFSNHFYFGTTINGVEMSTKTVDYVEKYMSSQVDGYVLTLQKNDGTTEQIAGKDISLSYRESDTLEKALKKQNPFLWPKAFWEKEQLEIPIGVQFHQDTLVEKIDALECVKNKKVKKSKAAKPVFQDGAYVIQKEEFGNEVNRKKLEEVIIEHLNGFVSTLNLEESNCYIEPKYYSDSKEVLEAQEKMNSYLRAEVTYDFSPYTEVVDAKQISKWLTVNSNMEVTFHKNKVKAYIQNLADQYNTSGKVRTFRTANGKTVQVRNGIYGWKLNQEAEYKKLLANIKNGDQVKREPEYIRRAVSHKGNDFGNTYAEVDLTTQHMWFIKNGEIVMDSPIVTGNPNKGNATPQGTYTVSYTQKGAVLRGPLRPDGTREWESPVDYWMPFNGGIGFHDASWQSAFGGDRYQTHGSHGCINMPHDKAQALFGYLRAGTPVICHY